MSFNLGQMEPSNKGKIPMPIHLGQQPIFSINKQSAKDDVLPRYHAAKSVDFGSQQLHSSAGEFGFTNNQLVQMGLLPKTQTSASVGISLHHSSSSNRFPSGKDSLSILNPVPISVGPQFSVPHKWPAQREVLPKFQNPIAGNLRLQNLPLTNKRPAQMIPPPKAQTESFESVRAKLRESLAASLATVSRQQEKPQAVEKSSPKDASSSSGQVEVDTQSVESCPAPANTSLYGSSSETLMTTEGIMKCDEGREIPSVADSNGNASDRTEVWKSNVQVDQLPIIILDDETSIKNNPVITDELLQGHGLCWESDLSTENSETTELMMDLGVKKPKLVHEEVIGDTKGTSVPTLENLALKIEAELFKLFGGVNKKYKEKARSLLFNLKDRSNPELKERVLSGDIAPERLCSMTAEELASKELSDWRLAKAEELVQMVVLPDSDVDIRRLVRKTHKGEFQVEVEKDDSISVEVAVGTSLPYRIPTKANEDAQTLSKSNDKSQDLSKPSENKASEDLLSSEKVNSGEQNASSNLDMLLTEKADFMQDFMVDELKDAEFLPPIVSLDEFMDALDSEPPFENLAVDTVHDVPSPAEKASNSLEPETNTAAGTLEPKEDPVSGNLGSKLDSQDSRESKLCSPDKGPADHEETPTVNAEKEENNYTKPDDNLKLDSLLGEPDICLPDITSHSEKIWEGSIQLNISAVVTSVGFYKSGEKPNMQEWPTFLEIKGRVRLDSFENFLRDLPLSRSRAIMVTQFCWKDGSPESGRLNLSETIDSYVADGRVGIAEPAPAVELYFCPPHPKTIEMLAKHLPKEHTDTIHSIVNGLIGVVVWRRPHVTTISRRLPSHKHGSSSTKRQLSSRKQENINYNSITRQDEPIDAVPPGFGPQNSREEDELPEFDFAQLPTASKPSRLSGPGMPHPHVPPVPRPVDQMRESINKYGHSVAPKKPWNDDDDIPEWQPHHDNRSQPPPQQLQPPPTQPPPPPQPRLHGYQQQNVVQNLLVTQQMVPMAQPSFPTQQLVQLVPSMLPVPMMQPGQPQMGLMPGPQNVQSGWQQAHWWPQAQGPADVGVGLSVLQPWHFGGQPSEGQFYGMQMPGFDGVVQNGGGMGWRPNVPRNR